MPTNFERTCDVLTDLASKSTSTPALLDAAVKVALTRLSGSYASLMDADRDPVDYETLETQIAYSFRCLATHADLLFRTLSAASSTVVRTLGGKPLKIACIGGGPGSDALGFIKFVERSGLHHKGIEFFFLDREPAWKCTRKALFKTFGIPSVSRESIKTDLAIGTPWTADWSFVDADLFTLSFVLSEVWAFDGAGSVSGFIDRLVSSAKKGALFAYTDNGGDSFMPHAQHAIADRPDICEIYGNYVLDYAT